jgi:sulfoxide reductase catalytic subunit YedY
MTRKQGSVHRHRILPSEITPEPLFFDKPPRFQRREVLKGLSVGALASLAAAPLHSASAATERPAKIPGVKPSARYRLADVNTWEDITTYNNFYEFGLAKEDPARYASRMRVKPWSVEIAGEADKTGVFALEDLLKPHGLEERIYRFRCVEAWSRVVPWVGIPLGDMLKRFAPNSRAKYVEFTTLMDPSQMPGQRRAVLDWPYVEGLRIDEAMHPLAMLVVGVYGHWLPNQNGAPLRLIVPWKYGFKSVKSIVRIRFTSRQPRTSWNLAAPDEYGFYANVNPAVDHPRWSQAKERRIGQSFLSPRIDTLPFNGYADEVSGLYQGMNLRRFY